MVILEISSCLLDQNRWQPWEYQFLLMTAVYAFFASEKKVKTGWQIIIMGLYFFSGISKFNHGFILKVWNDLILHQWLGLTVQNQLIYRMGYLLPLIEIFAAIGLIFNRSRKPAVIMLCLMHVFNLLLLGPLGLDLDSFVIWPWNILMPFLLLFLFYKNIFEHSPLMQKPIGLWFIALLCWILPWLNLAGYWDDYLSFTLYSGKTQHLFICISDPAIKHQFHDRLVLSKSSQVCDSTLSIYKWSLQELKVSPNPELRVYKEIIRQWEKNYDTTATDKFILFSPKFSSKRWVILPPN